MLNNATTMFPPQKLPFKKKTDEWKEACVDYIIGMGETVPSGAERTNFEEMQSYYDLYNSVFHVEELKYVTDPFIQEDGFPASPQDFNIIRPKIDLLLGEETKRPFNFRVIRTSQDAVSDVQDKMKQMITDYVMEEFMAGMTPEAAQQFQEKLQSGEIAPPEKIASFIGESYKDIAEDCAYHSLAYLKEKLGLNHEFHKGWKDAIIAGKEVYYTGIQNGEPNLERVNPMYFGHDRSPDLEFIEDGDWAVRRMRMAYTEVYDRLFDKMNEKDLDALLELIGSNPNTGAYGKDFPSAMDYNHIDMRVVDTVGSNNVNSATQVNMWHAVWKSYKKIGFVTIISDNGEPEQVVVSEDYMVTGEELSIDWKWVIEVWEGYRVGEDLYIGIQPLEYQAISTDNPNSQKLPYSGVIYSNTNSQSRSLVSIMKPLQYMYIIIWYRLELALARDKGKVITMDITQIPKSMNIDPAKWMHYLSSVGVNFVNPYEDGWDIPGREGGKASQFNQISALDLTMSNVISEYINIMSKIEDMISEISGISKQRQGAISSSELVGNVERSVTQSANITEPLFWIHNQAKKNALRILLNTAKEAWRGSGRKNIQYVFNDSTRTFMNLSENFFYEDYDIFVSDSTKDQQNIEQLKTLYQPAMQNGATLLDIAEIMTLDNVTQIKAKLSKIAQIQLQTQQQQQEQEQQNQMQQIQAQNEVKQQQIAVDQQKMDLEKYKIDTDNETKITVAELNAYKGQQDMDLNNDGIPDPMEIANVAIQRDQHEADKMNATMDREQKEREIQFRGNLESKKIESDAVIAQSKNAIDNKKIALENKKLETQKKLQEMKDKAAMERERLKTKTAIKNKTSGER